MGGHIRWEGLGPFFTIGGVEGDGDRGDLTLLGRGSTSERHKGRENDGKDRELHGDGFVTDLDMYNRVPNSLEDWWSVA